MSPIKSEENVTDSKKGLTDVKKDEQFINLKVLNQDGTVIHFKIKKYTPLKKLMQTFCERTGLSMVHIRFRFDGEVVNAADTPEKLNMEDGDAIDVFQEQFAGSIAESQNDSTFHNNIYLPV